MIKNYVSPTIKFFNFTAPYDNVLKTSDNPAPFKDIYKSDFLVSDSFDL